MTQAAIAGEIHQPLDVHRGLATKITFDGMLGVDRLTKVQHLLIGQVLDAAGRLDAKLGNNLAGLGAADAVDVSKRASAGFSAGDRV